MSIIAKIEVLRFSYFGLRARERAYRLRAYKTYPPDAVARKRYKDCSHKKPASQIRKEVSLCWKYWKCYPFHYFRYSMYHRESLISEEEMIDYIPDFFFYGIYLPVCQCNSLAAVFSNKVLVDAYFRGLGIRQADTVGKICSGRLYNSSMEDMDFKELHGELSSSRCQKVFVKPCSGEGGHGIDVFTRDGNTGEYRNKRRPLDADYVQHIAALDNYVVQMGVVQARELEQFAPRSTNTCRIVTSSVGGPVRIIGGLFRTGVGEMEVDNADSGGIYAPLDVENGRLSERGRNVRGELFVEHPGSKVVFKGFQIPRWPEIRDFAICCARKVPQMGLVGWDVALSADGPVLIEANNGFGLVAMQTLYGGLRQRLGIGNPDLFWRSGGKPRPIGA